MKEPESKDYKIRLANMDDVPGISACVDEAFSHYVPRMGKPPGPMQEDYSRVIIERDVSVVDREGEIIGVLVLASTSDGLLLDIVAVHPNCQGQGLGRKLLVFAEDQAREQGFNSIYLCTNIHMTENQVLYGKIGYREYERREEKGYSRVYMRKNL